MTHNNQKLNIQNKEEILKVASDQVTYKDRTIRVTPDYSIENLKARREDLDRCSTDS